MGRRIYRDYRAREEAEYSNMLEVETKCLNEKIRLEMLRKRRHQTFL
jgi:hypothetical protein